MGVVGKINRVVNRAKNSAVKYARNHIPTGVLRKHPTVYKGVRLVSKKLLNVHKKMGLLPRTKEEYNKPVKKLRNRPSIPWVPVKPKPSAPKYKIGKSKRSWYNVKYDNVPVRYYR